MAKDKVIAIESLRWAVWNEKLHIGLDGELGKTNG